MNLSFDEKLNYIRDNNLQDTLLKGFWGIEKENLRVTADGNLAVTAHPSDLLLPSEDGFYTLDFSESQLEIVTNPFDSIEKAYEALKKLNDNAGNILENAGEYLWPNSMPCILPDEGQIPIAKFPPEEKHCEIYRKGLAVRYGKKMQMISGIHYNYSLNSHLMESLKEISQCGLSKINFKNNLYFCLGRNILKYSWFLIYLLGSSPVVDGSYEKTTIDVLKKIEKLCDCCSNVSDYYEEYATSIRMSWLGYNGLMKNGIHVSYNNLGEYLSDIKNALETKSDSFEKLGVFSDEEQIQLNCNILQKSSEYYAPVRFKSSSQKKNISFDELLKDGVDYLELRFIDLNPFDNSGITLSELKLVHLFVLFCLLEESPFFGESDYYEINENLQSVTLQGRKPGLEIISDGKRVFLKDKCAEIFSKLLMIADVIDSGTEETDFLLCAEEHRKKLEDNSLLPSQRIINIIKNEHKSFVESSLEEILK